MKVVVPGLNRRHVANSVLIGTRGLIGTLGLFGTLAVLAAAEPQLADFAAGIELNVTPDRPLIELPLPDSVYTTVTHWDLADLRVFDAQGVAVPHAFCPAPIANGTLSAKQLPIYTVAAPSANSSSDSTLTFTTADGSQLKVSGNDDDQLSSGASFILDARDVDQPLHALQLDWSTPNGAAEVAVRVLASTDLTQWQSLTSNTKLLHAKAAYGASTPNASPQQVEQQRIALPAARYQYLRVEPAAAGTELIINRANAEYLIPAPPPEPTWFSAGAPHADEAGSGLVYESDHHVPVSYLRVLPSTTNSRLRVSVQSRAQASAPWQTQWSGEVYSLRFNNEERATAPVKIAATSSPYWRLTFPGDAEPPASAPRFELGYLPLRLRFLAQGMGPYTLAYGSSRTVTSSAVPCDGLIAGLSSADKQQMIGTATLGEVKTLAGTSVLRVARELPIRKLVLWAILLGGVAAIVAVSLSLLKRNRGRQD